MLDCSKIDELMMDWLYQELDESSSARVAEHVEGCPRCSAEASALQRTRAAFRDLSPAEPPVALSAILLHEAARRAPAATVGATAADGEGGFWARVRAWFRPIALHPAAAAIATLVLIAGVAGTLYVRHGEEMTDTPDVAAPRTASSPPPARGAADEEAPPPAIDMPVAPEPAAQAEQPADEAKADRDGYTADVLGEERQAALSRKFESAAQDKIGSLALEKKPPAPRGKKASSKRAEPKGPIANAVSGADPLVQGELDGRIAVGGGGKGSAASTSSPPPAAQAAPPAPAETATARTRGATVGNAAPSTPAAGAPGAADRADDAKGDSGGYRAYAQKPMSEAELRASEGKLGAAVKQKNCAEAARIANDILDRNRDYYYKRVAASARPCQKYVASEMKARSARRASKNVGSGKNVGAAQKAKAAPRKDQAAETSAE